MSSARKLQLQQLLLEADFISVREKKSAGNLGKLGIEHAVAPDVVSVISRLHPGSPSRNYVALHANENLLTGDSFEALAKSLRASGVVPRLKVVVFAAGMALGHDSIHALTQLAEAIKDEERGADVVLMKDRRPLTIVDLISGARLVVSTSLHARIVAAAYGVPRVSLANSKVPTYAESWDEGWPHGVELHQLREVLEALSPSSPDPQHGSALAQLAEDNAMLAQAALVEGDAQTRAARRLERGAKNTQEWAKHSSKIAERLRWAERGVLPYRTLAGGTLRRAIKGKRPSASYGEPI